MLNKYFVESKMMILAVRKRFYSFQYHRGSACQQADEEISGTASQRESGRCSRVKCSSGLILESQLWMEGWRRVKSTADSEVQKLKGVRRVA